MNRITKSQIECEEKLKKLLAQYKVELKNRNIIIGGDSDYIKGEFLDFTYDIDNYTFEVYKSDEKSKDEIWLEIWDYENEDEMISDYIRRIELILKKHLDEK